MAAPSPRAVGSAFGPGAAWTTAQVAGIAGVAALLAGAVLDAGRVLPLFWNVVLPLLPLTFLLTPAIWRGVCPLATLNMIGGQRGHRRLRRQVSPWMGFTGMVLLALIVPARRFLLHGDGVAFALLVAACAVLALGSGFWWEAKAGFCNSICPVLPVERLYGQRPVLRVESAACAGCELCTPRGCLDLAEGPKATAQVLGPTRRTGAWIGSAFGAFAAAFPGFVIGFGISRDVPVSAAWLVYGYVALCAVASWLLVRLVVRTFRLDAARAVPALAALAAAAYYWFAGPTAARTLSLGPGAATALQAVTIGSVALWYGRTLRT